ncbi:hypothetical protein PHET_04248 [Paragonimus heterotremus]|uniref:Uncharacterized protein n=1 Tax=Paragonimus heterotremus TaxID=100268 RepID=A0A8J4TG48_9TREM|nr:hypothetical protein PHET_04248 [Paragonimus heterotremus]
MGKVYSRPLDTSNFHASRTAPFPDAHECALNRRFGRRSKLGKSHSNVNTSTVGRVSPSQHTSRFSLSDLTRRFKRHFTCRQDDLNHSAPSGLPSDSSTDTVSRRTVDSPGLAASKTPQPTTDHGHDRAVSSVSCSPSTESSTAIDPTLSIKIPNGINTSHSDYRRVLLLQHSATLGGPKRIPSIEDTSCHSSHPANVDKSTVTSFTDPVSSSVGSSKSNVQDASVFFTNNQNSFQSPVHVSPSCPRVGGTNAIRASFFRAHSRNSPYERLSSPSVSEFPTLFGSSLPCSVSPRGDFETVDKSSEKPKVADSPTRLSATSRYSDRRDTSVSSVAEAFQVVPASRTGNNSPDIHVRHSRLSSEISLSSLASDDLMLDTDISWSALEAETTTASKLRKERPLGQSNKDSFAFTRLESVTELSHDDLSKCNKPSTEEDTVAQEQMLPCPSRVKRRSFAHREPAPTCVCPNPTSCDCTTCSHCCASWNWDRRRNTSALCGSLGRTNVSSLRRLRSLPGRARSGSFSSGAYTALTLNLGEDCLTTHLGERAFILLGSDQRQMLQEIQGIKLTLLKLRRLLTEDQLHLPLFHEQLHSTEPLRKPRIRQPLPSEWLIPHSLNASMTYTPPNSTRPRDRTLSEPTKPEDRQVKGHEDISEQLDDENNANLTDPSTPTSSVTATSLNAGSDVVARLIENLSQLHEENLHFDVQYGLSDHAVSL